MTSLPAAPPDQDEVASYVERGLEHLWVHTQQLTDLAKEDGLKVFTRGEGIYLWDMKGRQFIDAMSGLWVVNAGHGRAERHRPGHPLPRFGRGRLRHRPRPGD